MRQKILDRKSQIRFCRRALFILSLVFTACGPIVRPYYSRSAGGYITPNPSRTPTIESPLKSASFAGFDLSGKEDHLRSVAESYLGTPYSWGGTSHSGIDCSGFVSQVFREAFGIKLPHNSTAIYDLGGKVDKEDLKAGDIVFFKSWGFIDHSGIYMGKNYFIHSASSVGVSYSTLDAPYFESHYAGARRLR